MTDDWFTTNITHSVVFYANMQVDTSCYTTCNNIVLDGITIQYPTVFMGH